MKHTGLKPIALVLALFFVVLVFGMPGTASAIGSTRYWVGGSGTWDTSDTSHWSASSGGASGASVPTSADNCVFDANSFGGVGTVTISGTVECLAMTWNSIASPPVLSIPAGQQLNTYGSLDFTASVAGMTVNGPGFILLRAPSSAGIRTIATNNLVNIATGILIFDGGSYQLSGPGGLIANTLYLVSGTFDANDFDVTLSNFSSSNSNVRTLFMGTGTWTLNAVGSYWDISTATNMTLNPEASTLTFNATESSQKDFYGGGLSYQNVHFNGRNIVIHDSNVYNGTFAVNNAGLADALFVENGTTQTVANFTTNGSAGNLAVIRAFTPGTPFALTKSGASAVVVDYMTIADSNASGGGGWYAGTHSSDGGGNSGWIFAFPVDRYWIGGTGTWDGVDTSHWAYESGGTGGAVPPGGTNNVFFDDNSFSAPGQTVSMNPAQNVRDMTWTATDAPIFSISTSLYIYGSLTLAAGMTFGPTANDYVFFQSTGSESITTNGTDLDTYMYFSAAGTWTLQDNLTTAGEAINQTEGIFAANGFDVTAKTFISSNTNTRSIQMGSGAWTLTGTGVVWDIGTITGLTLDSGSSTVEITDTSATLKQFSGGNLTYRNLVVSGDAVEITDGNAFYTLSVYNAGRPIGLFVNNGTTVYITNFTTNGFSGNLARMQASTPGSPFTLHRPSGGTVSVDYMNISDSSATGATWYAGANSTDSGGNSGWIFTAAPDSTAPDAVSDLALSGATTAAINLDWTAPGDDGSTGTAASYDIRYSTSPINAGNFAAATAVIGEPTPSVAGSAELMTVSGLTANTLYYFAMKTSDEVPNTSAISNVISLSTTMGGGGGGGGGGGYYLAPQPTGTPMPTSTPAPQAPRRGDPANLPRLGLHEGEVVGDTDPNDPDVFIVNVWGYKRLFLNPLIYSFYGHLSALKSLKHITPPDRDTLPTSGLFRNCETLDKKVYALEVTGEDTGTLHWVNITGAAAVAQDPDFFKKDFCINNREFNWYAKSPVNYTSLWQLPVYRR